MRTIVFVCFLFLAVNADQRRLTDEERNIILEKHNEFKRKVANGEQEAKDGQLPTAADMRAYEYDSDVEDLAFEWASNCVWEHSTDHGGENLAAEGPSVENYTASLVSAVDGWFEEVKDFTLGHVGDFQLEEEGVTGHFTQVIWGNSYRLGCAVAKCDSIGGLSSDYDGGFLTVCNYQDQGNFQGLPVYTEGETCSQCPDGTGCNEGLCSAE